MTKEEYTWQLNEAIYQTVQSFMDQHKSKELGYSIRLQALAHIGNIEVTVMEAIKLANATDAH